MADLVDGCAPGLRSRNGSVSQGLIRRQLSNTDAELSMPDTGLLPPVVTLDPQTACAYPDIEKPTPRVTSRA